MKPKRLSINQLANVINTVKPQYRPALQVAIETGQTLIFDTSSVTGKALKYSCEAYKIPFMDLKEVFEVVTL